MKNDLASPKASPVLGDGSSSPRDSPDIQRRRRSSHKLARVLTSWDLTLLGVGMIVGAGIFAMPGKAVVVTGPSLSLAFACSAGAVGIVALSYAELAAAMPTSGAAYAFTFAYVCISFACKPDVP